eukprot:gene8223-9670_t
MKDSLVRKIDYIASRDERKFLKIENDPAHCAIHSFGLAKNKTYSGWSWKNSGVSVLSYTPVLSRIMIASLFPYLIITIAFLVSEAQGSRIEEKEKYWALSTSIMCMFGFIGYSAYQIDDINKHINKSINSTLVNYNNFDNFSSR